VGHRCLSLMNGVLFQVKVTATGRPLVQRSSTEYVWYCVISKPQQWSGLGMSGATAPQLKNEHLDVILIGSWNMTSYDSLETWLEWIMLRMSMEFWLKFLRNIQAGNPGHRKLILIGNLGIRTVRITGELVCFRALSNDAVWYWQFRYDNVYEGWRQYHTESTCYP